MSATFIEVAKFIADKLIITLIILGATIEGNFLLEKYKMSSSISIADSNEIVKRLELLWAKAYEVEAEAYSITVGAREHRASYLRTVPIAAHAWCEWGAAHT